MLGHKAEVGATGVAGGADACARGAYRAVERGAGVGREAMMCNDCGNWTSNERYCGPCKMKAQRRTLGAARAGASPPALFAPTTREIPPPAKPSTAEVVAWLTERCPHCVSPYTGNVEMEMPRDGRAFVELIGQAIEHGRSLEPRMEEDRKSVV